MEHTDRQDTVAPAAGTGFVPTEQDVAGVLAWFDEYERRVAAGDTAGMADMAMFPINTVTADDNGEGRAESWHREEFIATMAGVIDGNGEVTMESHRTPHFLSRDLVFVVTEGTITARGKANPVRYGDLLVRRDGEWVFQTMVQAGWS